jgi:hypothetical protein
MSTEPTHLIINLCGSRLQPRRSGNTKTRALAPEVLSSPNGHALMRWLHLKLDICTSSRVRIIRPTLGSSGIADLEWPVGLKFAFDSNPDVSATRNNAFPGSPKVWIDERGSNFVWLLWQRRWWVFMACVPCGRITCRERFLGSFLHWILGYDRGSQLRFRCPLGFVLGAGLCHKLPSI